MFKISKKKSRNPMSEKQGQKFAFIDTVIALTFYEQNMNESKPCVMNFN